MKDTGYCVVEALIVPEVLEHLAGVFARVEAERPESGEARANPGSGNFWMMDMMKEDPMMTRMCANPVMLTIMREYFGRDDMGFGHTSVAARYEARAARRITRLLPGNETHTWMHFYFYYLRRAYGSLAEHPRALLTSNYSYARIAAMRLA